jgi:hypothetical protein
MSLKKPFVAVPFRKVYLERRWQRRVHRARRRQKSYERELFIQQVEEEQHRNPPLPIDELNSEPEEGSIDEDIDTLLIS